MQARFDSDCLFDRLRAGGVFRKMGPEVGLLILRAVSEFVRTLLTSLMEDLGVRDQCNLYN